MKPSHTPRTPAIVTASSLVVGLLLAALPVMLVGPAAHAAYARLYEPLLTPMVGVPFTLKGIITSDVDRPLNLRVVGSGGTMRTIARSTATRQGTFTFRGVVLTRSSTLVATAPRFRGTLLHAKPEVSTAPVLVEAARQSGSLVALPPIVQQGASPEAPSNAAQVVASFQPARPGRRVQLQQKVRSTWRTVERARQDGAGFVAFPVRPGKTFRAIARPAGTIPAVTTSAVTSRRWKPAFEDTFSGRSLDAGVWSDRPNDGTEVLGKRTCARADSSARAVAGGTLRLGIGLDPTRAGETCHYSSEKYGDGTSPYLVNTQVDSRLGYHFTHGFAAARIRWHQPKGMHGGFWLQPLGGTTAGRPDLGAEVDVAEFFGQDTLHGGVGSFVHYPDASGANVPLAADPARTVALKRRGDQWWSTYHVFSVEWTASKYVFRVDGREFWRETRAVSQVGQYLLLSMLTSDYELKDLDPAERSATASVDWIRVWRS